MEIAIITIPSADSFPHRPSSAKDRICVASTSLPGRDSTTDSVSSVSYTHLDVYKRQPLLRFSGLDARAAPVTTVGVLLGLTYGGALIIEESDKQQFEPRTRFLALAWLCLSHALIEDTILLLALGANLWIVLVGRVIVTLVLIAALARLLGVAGPKAPVAGMPATG